MRKIRYDCHLHSDFSADSSTPASAMIERAIALGLEGLCFTEHLDLDCPPEGPDFSLDVNRYFDTLFALKEQYRNRIAIGIGLEFGIQPKHAQTLHQLAEAWPFDFIIASQHFVDGKDPYFPSFFEGHTTQERYIEYFQEILRNLRLCENTDFDTLGHLDYIVRYGQKHGAQYLYRDYADWIDPILQHLIDRGKCLELNTGGLKYGLGEPNPSTDVLARYRELGGEQITVGSDAHAPEHLAYDFATAESILQNLGFRYYTIFRQRKAIQIQL